MKKILVVLGLAFPGLAIGAVSGELPFDPQPGKCYTRVVFPAKYKVVREQVVQKPESYSLKTIPAQYAFENQTVVVREAGEKTTIIPATYKKVRERVLISEEQRQLTATPAKYKWLSKRVLVKPEGYEWKKGKGPLQKVDHNTGEILCYTKTPAVYKTIKEKVLVAEASTQEKVIEAKYGVVEKTVIDKPERIVKTPIAAQTKTIRVRKMVKQPREVKVHHPAQYGTLEKRVLAEKSYTKWQSILCQTNMTKPKISEIQKNLARRGLYKGPIDGIYGKDTLTAVTRFQNKHQLASGGLTEQTLDKLGITI